MITQENQTSKKTYGGFNLAILKVKWITMKEMKFYNSNLDH